MITNFETITQELTDKELELMHTLIVLLNSYTKENPVKAPVLCDYISVKEPRLRKMVNYIRSNGLLPLIATSKGYYVSRDRTEIEAQIESLKQRARSIERCAKGMGIFLHSTQQKLF